MDRYELACYMAVGRVSVRALPVAAFGGEATMYYAVIRGRAVANEAMEVRMFDTPAKARAFGDLRLKGYRRTVSAQTT